MDFTPILDKINIPKMISLVVSLLLIFILYKIAIGGLKKILGLRAKTKSEKNNVKMIIGFWRYIFLMFAVLSIIFVSTGSLAIFGLSAGLMSAALGWALQRPITGIAGWMMVMLKKPFKIGHRIIIGKVKGDVVDISLTHVYLGEIGGLTGGEERSGRVILIPNAKLFEEDIINYTYDSEYVLDQVKIPITFESDLKEATNLSITAAKKILGKDLIKKTQTPYVLNYFGDSSINLFVRYKCPTEKLQSVSSSLVKEIYEQIKLTKKVNLAYPHRVIIPKK